MYFWVKDWAGFVDTNFSSGSDFLRILAPALTKQAGAGGLGSGSENMMDHIIIRHTGGSVNLASLQKKNMIMYNARN